MNAHEIHVSVIDPIGPAFEKVKTILFRPFDLGKWFIIGFCAWLARLGEGGFHFNFNLPFRGSRHHGTFGGQLQAVFSAEDMERILSYEPRSDEKIREIARGIIDGSIFCSDQCPGKLLGAVFMLLMFLEAEHLVEHKLRDISLLYETIDQAGPRSINGYPSFFSCKMLNGDEHKRLRKELKAMGAFDGQTDSGTGT